MIWSLYSEAELVCFHFLQVVSSFYLFHLSPQLYDWCLYLLNVLQDVLFIMERFSDKLVLDQCLEEA